MLETFSFGISHLPFSMLTEGLREELIPIGIDSLFWLILDLMKAEGQLSLTQHTIAKELQTELSLIPQGLCLNGFTTAKSKDYQTMMKKLREISSFVLSHIVEWLVAIVRVRISLLIKNLDYKCDSNCTMNDCIGPLPSECNSCKNQNY